MNPDDETEWEYRKTKMENSKIVYGWVVDWGVECHPRISIDLFFSSPEKFKELLPWLDNEQLVEVSVPDDFDHLDFVPDNY